MLSGQDFRCHFRVGPELRATEICNAFRRNLLKALRQPPQTVCFRVVLYWLGEGEGSVSDLLDICGLGLQIGPRFFDALFERANYYLRAARLLRKFVPLSQPTDPFKPTYAIAGNQIATIARNYLVNQAEPPPVLLIVGWDNLDWEDDYPDALGLPQPDQDHDNKSLNEVSKADRTNPTRSRFLRTRTYCKILDQLLKRTDGAEVGNEHLLTLSTLPMMHVDTIHIQAKLRSLRQWIVRGRRSSTLDNREANNLENDSFSLRRHIEDSDSSRKSILRYACSLGNGEILGRQEYLTLEELWKDAISEGRLLETEALDILQLRASESSLQESRKSIELPSHQIEESRRVRIFTILAFVYVPLNTVTSIYGMNIQQINGSGHNIWAFAVTSNAALLITALTWYTIEGINTVKAALRKVASHDRNEAPKYSLSFRMYMLGWLATNWHFTWMWKSRAWLEILRSSDERFDPCSRSWLYTTSGRLVWTACDYVAYYMDPEEARGFNPFH